MYDQEEHNQRVKAKRDKLSNMNFAAIIKNRGDADIDALSVIIETEWFDESDCTRCRFTLEKKDDGLLLSYSKYNWWITGQDKEIIRRKRFQLTSENLDLYCLLCKEIFHAAHYNCEFVDYDINGNAYLVFDDRRLHVNFISEEMIAILLRWAKANDTFIDCAKPYDGLQPKQPAYIPIEENEEERKLFEFVFSVCGKKQMFFIYDKKESGKRFEMIKQEGDNAERNSKIIFDFEKEHQNVMELFKTYVESGIVGDASSPFEIVVDGKKYRYTKIEKRLLDLINYFSPERIVVPNEFIIDNHNSEYVCVFYEVKDEAYLNNQYIKYLRIISDSKRIGKRAFYHSSLEHVELSPHFFAYIGTGKMPIVEKDAFSDCPHLEVLINGKGVYLGNSPNENGYSIEIARLKDNQEKIKYKHRKEYHDGVLFSVSKEGVTILKVSTTYDPDSNVRKTTIPSELDGEKVVRIESNVYSNFIIFCGTIADWKAITINKSLLMSNTIIHCTDGNVNVNM
ncbi:MAG: hypothetical protein K5765_00795 [Clostridia bacterium]|nr:hypothetical protein [Clostridia bacterium]